MKSLIQLWIITLLSMVITLVLLVYGYITNDSTVFFAGDLIGVPFSIMCNLAYRRKYYDYFNNARNIK